jgi:hypothetical protein
VSFVVSPTVRAAAPPDQARITAVANVTLRAMPSTTAAPVAQVPLGTEVVVVPAGLDKTWLRVKLADDREGWVQSSLTKSLDPVWRWPVFDGIIADRLSRTGDKFPAQAELVAFVERVLPEYTNPDGRARMELARLRAVSLAANAIPFKQSTREPYAAWLASRSTEIIYDVPGGHWMLRDKTIWDVHQKYAASPVADDIAWFAVTNGLSGECEGHVACYLYVQNQLVGEYLRLHPSGRYATDAVDKLVTSLDAFAPGGLVRAAYRFERTNECAQLATAIGGLTTALLHTKVPAREAALARLAALRNTCG